MVTMVRYAVDLPVDAIEAQIGGAFYSIIQVSRGSNGARFLSAISDVTYDKERRARIILYWVAGSAVHVLQMRSSKAALHRLI